MTTVVMCLHHLFEKLASERGDAPAVICGQECLTYTQLDTVASRLARELQVRGVGPGKIVGIYFERSLELIVSILATLKAGATYLPLDRALPASRISFMLEEVEAPLLLTQSHLVAEAPAGARETLPVNLDELSRRPEPGLTSTVEGSDLAYVIYTSGSTGKPKGVLIEHHSVTNYITAVIHAYGIRQNDRILQLSSLSFDASVEEMFIALCAGAALVLRNDEMISSVATFLEKCSEFRINVIGCPTAFWHELVNLIEEQNIPLPETLRIMIIGGEQASVDRMKAWQKHAGTRVQLFNTYGPTETTIAATLFPVPEDWAGDHVPIGRTVNGMEARVLDANLRPVNPSGEGELYLGGAGVARGYLKRPELTATKFIRDPFGNPSDRLYKTGDLVRLLPDGNLLFIGRIDQQVKIGGFRVEISEIELALEKHPKVRQAVVLAREDKPGRKQLAAYLVLSTETRAEELRGFVRRQLPDYMVPVDFVFLDKLPVTPNGKTDRAALPRPADVQSRRTPREWKPRNPIELQLQVTFARFFERTDIGPETSFFELGGNSLQALRIIVEVERAIGKNLPLGILFKAPTIKELASLIAKESAGAESSSLVPLQPQGSRKPFFLVHTTPGDVLGYGNLVYHLDPDQPCYGFQSIGLISPEKAHQSIEEMARHYNRLMRTVQPEGPYYLGGWCYGGIVAMEMAQQLKLVGQEVKLLALLETPAPPPASHFLRYNCQRIVTSLRRSPSAFLRYAGAKLNYYRTRNQTSGLRFKDLEDRWSGEEKGYYEKLEFLYNTNMDAVNKYRSRPYDGTVLLLNAAERNPAIFPDRNFGWGPLVARIEAHDIPGKHDTILMEPHVHELAQLLESYLPQGNDPAAAPPKAEMVTASLT